MSPQTRTNQLSDVYILRCLYTSLQGISSIKVCLILGLLQQWVDIPCMVPPDTWHITYYCIDKDEIINSDTFENRFCLFYYRENNTIIWGNFFSRLICVGFALSFRCHFFIPTQRPITFDFQEFHTRLYPLHCVSILILEKIPFLLLSSKQGNYWYHF